MCIRSVANRESIRTPRVCQSAIESARPKLSVKAVTGGPGPTWLASFLSAGGTANVDVIAFHGYWSATAADIVNVISNYTTVMTANGAAEKPMWDTERSWGGFGNLGTPSSSQQVGFVAKYYLLQWSQGNERFVWYAYDGSPIWGGLWSASAGESPTATSYSETYRWMVGATLTSPCSEKKPGRAHTHVPAAILPRLYGTPMQMSVWRCQRSTPFIAISRELFIQSLTTPLRLKISLFSLKPRTLRPRE